MAKSRHYGVNYAFPVRVKDKDSGKEKVVQITPRLAGQVDEMLTPAQIKAHLEAGNLTDLGEVIPEPKAKE